MIAESMPLSNWLFVVGESVLVFAFVVVIFCESQPERPEKPNGKD